MMQWVCIQKYKSMSRNEHLPQFGELTRYARPRADYYAIIPRRHFLHCLARGDRRKKVRSGIQKEYIYNHLSRVDVTIRKCHRHVIRIHNLLGDMADYRRICMMRVRDFFGQLPESHAAHRRWTPRITVTYRTINVLRWMLVTCWEFQGS